MRFLLHICKKMCTFARWKGGGYASFYRKRAAEPYQDIDKVAFAIYSLTYLETWEISMCIAQVQWMSTRSLLICTYTSVCIVLNKGRMPARRRGRFVVWRYGYSQDLKVWTRNRSCLFLYVKLPKTARKPCQNTHANGTQTQKNQLEPTDFLPTQQKSTTFAKQNNEIKKHTWWNQKFA